MIDREKWGMLTLQERKNATKDLSARLASERRIDGAQLLTEDGVIAIWTSGKELVAGRWIMQ